MSMSRGLTSRIIIVIELRQVQCDHFREYGFDRVGSESRHRCVELEKRNLNLSVWAL